MSCLRYLALAAAVAILTGGTAHAAPIIGSTVDGSIRFAANPTNFYDPANGFVPTTGFQNSSTVQNSNIVTISGSAVEFGYLDSANRDTADFTGTQLIITDQVFTGASNWTQTFQDSSFVGANFALLSSNFPGTFNGTLVGDTVTVTWSGSGTPGTFQAVFTLAAAEVPEPATMTIWGTMIGLGTAAGFWKRRRQQA